MTEWKDTTETTTQDEDAWVDELYKNNPEFHNDNDDMINDEEVKENNGQTKRKSQRTAFSRYHPWDYRLGGLLRQHLDV